VNDLRWEELAMNRGIMWSCHGVRWRLCSIVACIGCLTASAPLWADWAQYRHDAAHTGRADDPAPPPLELRWKQTDGSDGQNPDFCGCRLYAFEDALYFKRRTCGLVRLEAETGKVVWEHPNFPNDYVIAVDSGAIIATNSQQSRPGVWRAWIDAYDVETGTRRWRLVHPQDLPGYAPSGDTVLGLSPQETRRSIQASCLVRDGMVCASGLLPITKGKHKGDYEACLLMVDIAHGRVVGASPCNPGRTEPLLAPGALAPTDSGFYEAEVAPYRDWFRLRAWGQSLMVLAHYERRPVGRGVLLGPWAVQSDAVLAISPDDVPGLLWGPPDPWPTVALAEGAGVALGTADPKQPMRLIARDAYSGQLLWVRPLLNSPYYSSPAVDDSTAYVGLTDGYVYAVRLRSGEPKWATKVGEPVGDWSSEPSRPSESAPICSVADKHVWVLYHETLMALKAGTGEIEWQTDQTLAGPYEPVVDNGWVYLVTRSGIEAWGPPARDGETRPQERKLNEG
jgi:outer membrane protein assembly factor BamB